MVAKYTSVHKICQLTGECDRQINQPVFNRTESRVGIFGTDLGSSFEHNGRLWFLFGDTWPSRARATGLAAVSRYPGHMELFYLLGSGIVDAMPNLDERWLDPLPLCGARFSHTAHIAAVSRDPRHMEVFAVGEDGIMRGRLFWEDTWHDWYVLGDARFSQTAGVAAVSRDPKHMEVFTVGEDGILRGRWFREDTWHDWYMLGDARFSQTAGVAAVSRDPRHMEVFAVGEDGIMRGRLFWEDTWHDWYVLGDARFSQTAGVAAVSRDPKHMEVFAIGEDGKVRARWFWEDTWHEWYMLGDQQFSQDAGLAAVSRSAGLMDVFGIRNDGIPSWTWFAGSQWKPWTSVQTLTDSVAWTAATEPGPHLPLNFMSNAGPCARYRSPRLVGLFQELVNTGGFSVPISGFSAGGKMYVFYSEYADTLCMGRTYLAIADGDDPTRLRALYVTSIANMDQALDGHFINIACKVVPEGHPSLSSGLPFAGPALLLWGSGRYRHSQVYLAAVPLAKVENRGAWLFYTGSAASPWSPDEHKAKPVLPDGRVGELSVSWIDSLGVWLLLYGDPSIRGAVAPAPWGPWSDAQTVVDIKDANGQFVHNPNAGDVLSDPGRESDAGGLYGAYLIDRFTQPIDDRKARFYFLMSTWNPYNTMLMTGTLEMI